MFHPLSSKSCSARPLDACGQRTSVAGSVFAAGSLLVALWLTPAFSRAAQPEVTSEGVSKFLKTYCRRCHNDYQFSGNWSLSDVNADEVHLGKNRAAWEKILRMTKLGTMPPADRKQPTADERIQVTGWLQSTLDGYAERHPDPGRATLRRLNRAEYANAVRDLLALELDITDQLPADDSGYGFDNIADVLSVSSTLMDRYFATAGYVSRLAVGKGSSVPVLTSYQVPKDGSILNQGIPAYNERAASDLPIDSRGGGSFAFFAPQSGDYKISGYLNANTNNEVDRLEEARYELQVPLQAGTHQIGMSFRKQLGLDESVQTLRNDTDIVPLPTSAPEELRLDFIVDGARAGFVDVPSYHMSARFAQKNFPRDVLQIDVEGPYNASIPDNLPSQQAIFSCVPTNRPESETACAKRIISRFSERAYRRPVKTEEKQALLQLFQSVRQDSDFKGAIASVIQAVLVSPSFLFVQDHRDIKRSPLENFRISDYELATRLALFLWSSVPDEELLALARRDRLHRPRILHRQVARMLASEKAEALTENFAGQWLYLRNIDHHRPDVMAFPEFDVPLRAAMREETERFFAGIVHNNKSLLEIIRANYSYLNERLANHYGLKNIRGSQLRPVNFPSGTPRGGILGHASLLTLTSYSNHTSVVRRGQWILNSLLAEPPPPPPADVPALVAKSDGRALNAREQLEMHRAEPACASCHVKMDPLGLSLENYNAIGAFRTEDANQLIDAAAEMPDGTRFSGLQGLQSILLDHKDQFAEAFTEHLLTYALGRGLTSSDRPVIRSIAANAADDDYRVHDIILGIVESYPFNYRKAPEL